MKINIYNKEDIKKIKESCLLVNKTLNMIEQYLKPNISTGYIDKICYEYIINNNGYPAPLGYMGFPKSICISVNNIVCHGIPDFKHKLKHGDILNIDISILKDGYYGDGSKMFFIGKPSLLSNKLCYITKKSLDLATNIIKPGLKIKYIGKIIEKYVEENNFSIVKEYCGHGIGKNLHELPYIHHYYLCNNNTILLPGMVITIEPIVNVGKRYVEILNDGWSVKTKDNSLSAQYENTILVTNNGFDILTNI